MEGIQVFNIVKVGEPLPSKGFVGVDDAAKWLGLHRETVRRMIEEGRLKGVVAEGGRGSQGWRYVVPVAALQKVAKLRKLRQDRRDAVDAGSA